MIIVKLMGGLGNQMFQYAFGRTLSLRTNSELKLDVSFLLDRTPRPNFTFRDYDLNIFNIIESFTTPEEMIHYQFKGTPITQLAKIAKLRLKHKYYIKEQLLSFYPNLTKLNGDIYLDGYWQNEKYFKDYDNIIRHDFKFKLPVDLSLNELTKLIKSTNSVSITIRRGDYLKAKVSDQIYYICDADYYKRAIYKITNLVHNPKFFVFSDDLDWCKKNLPNDISFQFIDQNYAGKKYQHYLQLITFCKHHIIANSTFHWWGAWLNPSKEKTIICPKHWFSPTKFHLNTNPIAPPGWIKL